MRTSIILTSLAFLLAACGGGDGDVRAEDTAGGPSADAPADAAVPAPSEPPAAEGLVRSRSIATVMDTGDGPELCLGPVAESYPPQCGGPAIEGWDWAAQAPNFDRQGDVRWGTFAVTGRWDGTTFSVTDAVPGALYDAMPEEPSPPPTPSRRPSQRELEAIAHEVGESLPGAQGAYADPSGHVVVDVIYDDGSLQDHVDAAYGGGVVLVNGALVDA